MSDYSDWRGHPLGGGGSNDSITLSYVTVSQSVTLTAANTSTINAKVWLVGSGASAYQVMYLNITQGSISVPITVNSQTSFYVPALGRWSDWFSTTSFTIPGTAVLVGKMKLNVPFVFPIIDGNSQIGCVSAISTENSDWRFVCNFEGEDEYAESNILSPMPVVWEDWTDAEVLAQTWEEDNISVSYAKFGTHSYKLDDTKAFSAWCITGSWYHSDVDDTGGDNTNYADNTWYFWFKIDNVGSTVYQDGVMFRLQGTDYHFYGHQYVELDFYRALDGSIRLYMYAEGHEGVAILNPEEDGADFPANQWVDGNWHHFAFVAKDGDAFFYMDGIMFCQATAQEIWGYNTAYTGTNDIVEMWTTDSAGGTSVAYFDAMEYVHEALWDGNFTPSISAPSAIIPADDITVVTSTFTVTVSDNTLVDAGDTITVVELTGTKVFTFVTIPTGLTDEIAIGLTAAQTAINIAYAFNITFGAEFTATSDGSVITVVKYTADTVTVTDDSDGITIGTVTQTITYYPNRASSAIPSFSVSGTALNSGDLGDYYGNVTIPALTATGTSVMTGNNGIVIMPSFTASAQSYLRGYPTLLTDVQKTALLMYGNDWMEWVASLIAIPGDADDVALVATQWVANNITYTTDLSTWGVADYWIDPRFTLRIGVGDSEEGAFLLASVIINSGVTPSRVRIYVGETYGEEIVWCMYRRSIDNQWVVLDWTEGADYWNAVSNIDDLTALYPSVLRISELSLNPDDYAYGDATEYIDYR